MKKRKITKRLLDDNTAVYNINDYTGKDIGTKTFDMIQVMRKRIKVRDDRAFADEQFIINRIYIHR